MKDETLDRANELRKKIGEYNQTIRMLSAEPKYDFVTGKSKNVLDFLKIGYKRTDGKLEDKPVCYIFKNNETMGHKIPFTDGLVEVIRNYYIEEKAKLEKEYEEL